MGASYAALSTVSILVFVVVVALLGAVVLSWRHCVRGLSTQPCMKQQGEDDQQMNKALSRERTDLIINRKWKEVLEWVVFDPNHDLTLPDKKGHTLLHHLCLFRAPIEIIQMVLWKCPELASQVNVDGEIPLHWAVRLSAPNECIRSLLQANPQSATSFRDKEGHSPLSLFWDRYSDRYMEVWWEGKDKLLSYRAWQRLILFFQPNPNAEDAAPSPLHAAARSACPPALFPLLIQVYKDQLHVLDSQGRNPLQIACSHAVANRCTDLRSKIQNLLQQDPTAAQHVNHNGRTALEIAALSGIAWNEGLQDLVDLAPHHDVICKPDGLTGLPPFLLAAVGATHRLEQAQERPEMVLTCAEKSLTTIFELLKTNPSSMEMILK